MASDYPDYPDLNDNMPPDYLNRADNKSTDYPLKYWWLVLIIVPLLVPIIGNIFTSSNKDGMTPQTIHNNQKYNHTIGQNLPRPSRLTTEVAQKLQGRWKLTSESILRLARTGARESDDVIAKFLSVTGSNEQLSNWLEFSGKSVRMFIDFHDDNLFSKYIHVNGKLESKLEQQPFEAIGDTLALHGERWYYFIESSNSLMLSKGNIVFDFERVPE